MGRSMHRCIPTLLLCVAAIMASASGQTLQDKVNRDQTLEIVTGDPDMAAAWKQARATLAEFLALADAPRPSTSAFAVKVGIRYSPQRTEYFWIGPFTHANGRFSGKIDNEPEFATSVKFGDTITFGEDEIVDWLYLDGRHMRGNFTACVLFRREPRAQAEAVIKKYGMDCKL
jgi:uncharacterized protein YegJ (DUF2314 family)